MGKHEVEALRAKVEQGGGEEKVAEQHRKGKLTARERLGLLLDPQSFLETDAFAAAREGREAPGEGVVTGFGTVSGRPVYVYSEDFTVLGGSLGRVHAEKICKVMDLALKTGVPVVALLDSAGARLHEGLDAIAGYGEVYRRITRCSGSIPQIGIVCGPCIGGAAYMASLMDFVFLAGKEALMQTWGPQVTAAGGGGVLGAAQAGAAHFVYEQEEECFAGVRELLALLPANSMEDAPALSGQVELNSPNPGLDGLVAGMYDMNAVISAISDYGYFFAVSEEFAPNMLTGFIRVNGRTAGVVANQPNCRGGVLDGDGCAKATRFLGFCDCFNIPVVTLVDTAGLALGAEEENKGILRRGAALIHAYAAASVPKVTVVCGRAHGGAFAMMGSRSLGMDAVFAWTNAEISVAQPETAVNILYSGEIASAEDPQAIRAALVERYKAKDADPILAARGGHVDDIIEPAATRTYVAAALEMLLGKRDDHPAKKRGNIPL